MARSSPCPGAIFLCKRGTKAACRSSISPTPRNPIEIAYFDRGPIDAEDLVTGGYWSTYWYNGHIYGTEIIRGIDVFALTPSDFLTANEIAAATLADQGGQFNPQQQLPNTWPAAPIVGMAYLDQWLRAHPDKAAEMDPLYDLLREADIRLHSDEKAILHSRPNCNSGHNRQQ